ncbi:hypothetical protein EMPG_15195, partial [Blastomyces silverae]
IMAMPALQDRIANPTLCTVSVLEFPSRWSGFRAGHAAPRTWSKSDHDMRRNLKD